MDITRCSSIQKALKIGAGLCNNVLAENIYPLQRELGDYKNNLSNGVKEIKKLKDIKMRVY